MPSCGVAGASPGGGNGGEDAREWLCGKLNFIAALHVSCLSFGRQKIFLASLRCSVSLLLEEKQSKWAFHWALNSQPHRMAGAGNDLWKIQPQRLFPPGKQVFLMEKKNRSSAISLVLS